MGPSANPSCSSQQTHCDFSQQFYFAVQGTFDFSFSYMLANGNVGSAVVRYIVSGPSPTGKANPSGDLHLTRVCAVNQYFCETISGKSVPELATDGRGAVLGFYSQNVPDVSGAIFQLAATDPSASTVQYPSNYLWMQLVRSRTFQYKSDPTQPSCSSPAGLDLSFPYPKSELADPVGTYAQDSPWVSLTIFARPCKAVTSPRTIGEISDRFQATMYLLWDPSLSQDGTSNPGCAASTVWSGQSAHENVASTCTGSIPIPLGGMTWGFCAAAVNTMTVQTSNPSVETNGTTWLSECAVDYPSTRTYMPTPSLSDLHWETVL